MLVTIETNILSDKFTWWLKKKKKKTNVTRRDVTRRDVSKRKKPSWCVFKTLFYTTIYTSLSSLYRCLDEESQQWYKQETHGDS